MDDKLVSAVENQYNGLKQPTALIKTESKLALRILFIQRLNLHRKHGHLQDVFVRDILLVLMLASGIM